MRCLRFLPWLCLLLLLGACENKHPRNGLLDGQWQLMRIDNVEVPPRRVYWRVQLDLLQIHAADFPYTTPRPNHGPLLRIRQTPTHFSVTQGYLVLRDEGRDSLISPSFPIDLAAWGVPRLPNDYTILTLNRQTLILKDDHHTLTFRRF